MLPKRAYNAVHPFTSFIPIFCYMVRPPAEPAHPGSATQRTAPASWGRVSRLLAARRTRREARPPSRRVCVLLPSQVLRNCSPTLRRYHMHLFAWCGKVTLETYILQFHIWMKTTGINGSPKFLMVWLPGWFYTHFEPYP